MADHDHSTHEPEPRSAFWRSRTGIALLISLAIAAALLGYEHRIHIFGGNMGSALLLLIFVGMHFFMHGGHGGHRAHRGKSKDDAGEKP